MPAPTPKRKRRAGETRDPEFRPPLERIVAAFSATPQHLVAFDALDALAALGASDAYFLGLAEKHAQDKWGAYYAILILSDQPASDDFYRAALLIIFALFFDGIEPATTTDPAGTSPYITSPVSRSTIFVD